MKTPKINATNFDFIWNLCYKSDMDVGYRFIEKDIFGTITFIRILWGVMNMKEG